MVGCCSSSSILKVSNQLRRPVYTTIHLTDVHVSPPPPAVGIIIYTSLSLRIAPVIILATKDEKSNLSLQKHNRHN